MSQETVAGTTADPTIKFVPLKLGDKEYKLCFDFDSIAIAEERTGMSLLAGVNFTNLGVRRIRAMLYASALKANPEVTLKEFTPHIKLTNIAKIQVALADAWVESMPTAALEDTNKAEEENPTPAPQTSES